MKNIAFAILAVGFLHASLFADKENLPIISGIFATISLVATVATFIV